MTDPTRGVLYPERLPRFERVAPGRRFRALVEWFWIPRWDLPDGVQSRQQVLSYPAGNLVVESSDVTLWGATTRATERLLEGSGWAVGAMLRPAAFARLSSAPAELVDTSIAVHAPALAHSIAEVMPEGTTAAIERIESWLDVRVGEVTGDGRLANAMTELLMGDASILRVEDAAARLAVSVRTLQRVAHRTVGLPPAAIIRRRRLQEAAQRLRDDPDVGLAEVAADLGYADHAHLTGDFRTVLGFTPSAYRRETST